MDESNQLPDPKDAHDDVSPRITHVHYSEEENKILRVLALYTFGWLAALAIIAAYFDMLDPSTRSITTYLIFLGCSGGIGGALNSILGFTTNYRDGSFDTNYKWSYYFRPIIGVILGIFIFYFAVGGLLKIQSDTDISSIFTFQTIMFFCALAFLVGYSSTNFLKKLEDISNAIFSEVKQDEKKDSRQKR